MINEGFVNRIVEMAAPTVLDVNGHSYTNGDLSRVKLPLPTHLTVTTLTSLVGFPIPASIKPMYHVVSPHQVHLVGQELNSDQERAHVASARWPGSDFSFDRYMSQEDFVVAVQTHFVRNEALKQLLAFTRNVRAGREVTATDDGVGQRVTVSRGDSLIDVGEVPNPLTLKPYRSFFEIDQVESEYLLRLKGGDEHRAPSIGLFTTDAEKWKETAMLRIAEYIKNKVGDKALVLV